MAVRHFVLPHCRQVLRFWFWLLAVAMPAYAANEVPNPVPNQVPNSAPATRIPKAEAILHRPVSKTESRPHWTELSLAQQNALAPLAGEWGKMDALRKKKWLEIGNKFVRMAPEEQQRVQERMREWIKLTPEQRWVARENYTRANKIDPDQKSAQWQQYQLLSDEQKKKLAARTGVKKQISNLPPPTQAKSSIQPLSKQGKPPARAVAKTENAITPAPTPMPVVPVAPVAPPVSPTDAPVSPETAPK